MSDEQKRGKKREDKRDPTEAFLSMFPGLAWTESMIAAQRAQAGLAADTLRQLNAPVVDALNKQREFATALADSAKQIAMVARQVEELGRRHAAITAQLQAALEPYLRYVDWLDRARTPPSSGGG